MVIVLVSLGLRLWHGNLKTVHHIDEGFSYLVAATGEDQFTRMFTSAAAPLTFKGHEVLSLYTLEPHERWQYAKVTALTAADVHPPLYYWLLHTAMAPGEAFPKWSGVGLNIVLHLCSLLLLFLIARKLLPHSPWLPLLVVSLWTFSPASLNITLFVRMYELLTLCALGAVWVWLRLLQSQTWHWKHWVLWTLTLTLGLLSHYYFLIWAALLCVAGAIYYGKQWQRSLFMGSGLAAAFGALLLIFPAAYPHLFSSYRAREIQTIGSQSAQAFLNLKTYGAMTLKHLLYLEVLLLMAVVVGFAVFSRINKASERDVSALPLKPTFIFWALAAIMVVFWLFSSGASPYIHIRYPALTFPFIALVIGVLPAYVPAKMRAVCIALLLTSVGVRSAITPIETRYPNVNERFQNPEYVGLLWLKDNRAQEVFPFWGLLNKLLPNQQYYYFTRSHFVGFPDPSPASELLNNRQIKNILNAVGTRDFAFTEVPGLEVLNHQAQ